MWKSYADTWNLKIADLCRRRVIIWIKRGLIIKCWSNWISVIERLSEMAAESCPISRRRKLWTKIFVRCFTNLMKSVVKSASPTATGSPTVQHGMKKAVTSFTYSLKRQRTLWNESGDNGIMSLLRVHGSREKEEAEERKIRNRSWWNFLKVKISFIIS